MENALFAELLQRFSLARQRATTLNAAPRSLPAPSPACSQDPPDISLKLRHIQEAKRAKAQRVAQQLMWANSQVQQLVSRLSQSSTKIREQETMLQRQEQRLNQQTQAAGQCRSQLQEYRSKVLRLEEIHRLQKEELLRQLGEGKEKYRESKREKRLLRQTLRQAEVDLARSQEKGSSLEAELRKEAGQTARLRLQNQSLADANRTLQNSLRSVEAELKKSNAAYNAALSMGSQGQRGVTHEQLRRLKQDYERTVAQKNEQIRLLKAELQEKKAKVRARREEQEQAVREQTLSAERMTAQLAQLREERQKMARQLDEARESEGRMRSELVSKSEQLMRVVEQGRRNGEGGAALQAELRVKDQRLTELERRLEQLRETALRRQKEVNSGNIALSVLQEKHREACARMCESEQQEAKMLEALGHSEEEKRRLQDELARRLQQAQEAEQREAAAREQYEQLLSEFKTVIEQMRVKELEERERSEVVQARTGEGRKSKMRVLNEIKGLIATHKVDSRSSR